MKYGHNPFGSSKHSNKMFTYAFSFVSFVSGDGLPKAHSNCEGLSNLVQVHCYEDC